MHNAATAQFLGRSTIIFKRFHAPTTPPISFPPHRQSNSVRTDDPSLPKRGLAEILYTFKFRTIRDTYATEPEIFNYSVTAPSRGITTMSPQLPQESRLFVLTDTARLLSMASDEYSRITLHTGMPSTRGSLESQS